MQNLRRQTKFSEIGYKGVLCRAQADVPDRLLEVMLDRQDAPRGLRAQAKMTEKANAEID